MALGIWGIPKWGIRKSRESPKGGGGGRGGEELDPRIQEELEHLNEANAEINRGELELDAARCRYRRVLSDSARRLNSQGSQLGACIERARPYYEARRRAKEAQQETQRAALRYERAVGMHNAAREMVFVAEQGMGTGKNRLDPTWQEMLNHATRKVNEAEQERLCSEREHQRVTRLCHEAEAEVQRLQKSLRRDIARSRPYFELKAQFNLRLEEHKSRVTSLEAAVAQAKLRYSVALRNLEQISEEIHARRFQRILRKKNLRENPLGAEGGAGNPDRELSASGDSLSLLSLRTIASDLQKFDSVEHLSGIPGISGTPDALSLHSEELGAEPGGGSRHQRSLSL
ncbi:SH3 domain-binding protein 5-like isoform X2 [Agelaius phoeniceus]|uniref:SH3 domain-binding protein 5-like isoform X2 n=1 Tax=Agelaius phoeniceus TaxID=39638 RepID=UPI004054AF87